MNQLKWERRAELKRLLATGSSVRAIASVMRITAHTVRRYRDLWEMKSVCPCGQSSGHQGWCQYRLAYSPNRRGWLAEHWQKRSESDLGTVVEAATTQAKALGHDLGRFVWGASSSASLAYALCKTCGKAAEIYSIDARERFNGNAVKQPCFTKAQLAAQKAANQETRTWRAAKRTLRQLRANLRASRSPMAASTPPQTSCE